MGIYSFQKLYIIDCIGKYFLMEKKAFSWCLTLTKERNELKQKAAAGKKQKAANGMNWELGE